MKALGETTPSLNELAHFGVKGMRWGIRKNQDAGGESSSKKELTPEEASARRKRNVKIAIGVAVAARVLFVVGSMTVATVLHNRSAMEAGAKALERSNMINTAAKRGVFKVTTL